MYYSEKQIGDLRESLAGKFYLVEEMVTKALMVRKLQFAQMGSIPCSKPFVSQPLTKDFYEALKRENCVFRIVRDHLRIYNGRPSARDENMLTTEPWGFHEDNGRVLELYVMFRISFYERGVTLYPSISSKTVTVMENARLNVFRAYSKLFPEALSVVHEIVAGQGETFVGWWEFGWEGARSIGKLFAEFANNGVMTLANSTASPFSFDPLGRNRSIGERERYVREPDQVKLFTLWQWEQNQFKSRL